MKKLVAIVSAMVVLASTCVSVMAADVKDVSAQVNYSLKMKVDNVEWNPTEEDGSALRPITYNGRTYLPVRALAEKLGISIDWDAETQTVLIGEKEWTPLTATMVDSNNAGYTTDPDALYNGSGVFNSGLAVKKEWIGNQFSDANILTDGKYTTMKVSAVAMGGDATFRIIDDETEQVYKEISLKANTVSTAEFNIAASKNIRIEWLADEDKVTSLVLGDIMFK